MGRESLPLPFSNHSSIIYLSYGELALQAERKVYPSTQEPDAGNAAVGICRSIAEAFYQVPPFFIAFLKGSAFWRVGVYVGFGRRLGSC